jgi:2-polyprenyl-3-methyl-5-hydroxy-6-metoxy-1,4-benzoquinol methylase
MIYSKYNRGAVHHLQYKTNKKYKKWVDWLISLFPDDGGTLLDLACGDGLKSQKLVDKGYEVIGVDCSEVGIHRAKTLVKGATFYIAEAASLYHWDLSFDYCLCSELIEHLEDQQVIVDMMERVDVMILTTPDREVKHRIDPFHIRELSWKELEEMFCDYNVERLYAWGDTKPMRRNHPFDCERTLVAKIAHKS